jgi:adenylate kinase
LKNIIFIGGIHGSGKGTICETLKNKLEIVHLTASEVLKWDELSSQKEKLVNDINETQNRLITNLKKIVEENKTYLLDGHYCLLNRDGIPEKISLQTFKDINPNKLILVIANPQTIKERLENRDTKTYDIRLIEQFQNHICKRNK